jgi:hypothetical protein
MIQIGKMEFNANLRNIRDFERERALTIKIVF